jgi:hypothetical protein
MNAKPQGWEIADYDGFCDWINIWVTAKEPKYLVRKSTSMQLALFANSLGYSNLRGATEVESEEDGLYSRSFTFQMNEQEKDDDVNRRCSNILLGNIVTGDDINTFYIADTKILKLQSIQANEEKYLSIKIFTKAENEAWNRSEQLFLSPTKVARLIELLGGSLPGLLSSAPIMNNVYQYID